MASPGNKAFLLRMDPTLHDALQRWADDDFRSLNAHIEFLLNESLKKAGRKLAASRKTEAPPTEPGPDAP